MNSKTVFWFYCVVWISACDPQAGSTETNKNPVVREKDNSKPLEKPPEKPVVERRERAAGLAVLFTDESVVNGFAFFYDEHTAPESLSESPEGFVPSGKCIVVPKFRTGRRDREKPV